MSLIIIVNETFITRKLHEVHGGVNEFFYDYSTGLSELTSNEYQSTAHLYYHDGSTGVHRSDSNHISVTCFCWQCEHCEKNNWGVGKYVFPPTLPVPIPQQNCSW